MKTSQWRRVVENRCVFSVRLKALCDRSGDSSACGIRFRVAGPLTAKLVYVCVAIALSLQEAEKKSKSQTSSSLYPSVSNVGPVSTAAVKNREPRKVIILTRVCCTAFMFNGS